MTIDADHRKIGWICPWCAGLRSIAYSKGAPIMPSQSSGSSNPGREGWRAPACSLSPPSSVSIWPRRSTPLTRAADMPAGSNMATATPSPAPSPGAPGTVQVHVRWRGNRFVVQTPMGTYPLKRAGSAVRFRVYFDKAWASVTLGARPGNGVSSRASAPRPACENCKARSRPSSGTERSGRVSAGFLCGAGPAQKKKTRPRA